MAEVLEVFKYIGVGILVIGFSALCIYDYAKKIEKAKHRHA